MGYTNTLPLSKNNFTLRFTKPTRLPPFIGNTVRGALGQSLSDNYRDVYDMVFKPEIIGMSIPNPFVISAPYPSKGEYQKGDELDFSITLFGSACRYEEEVKYAALSMCKGKLAGTEHINTECEYSRQWSDEGAEFMPCYDVLTVIFITPTEILQSKKPVTEPDFSTFIDSLFGRISGIIDNYTESQFILPYSLIASKPLIRAEYQLRTVGFTTGKQPINGFTGAVRYTGDITSYLPYIDLGSQLHIGKKTTRSCGKYSFDILGEEHRNG